jgi:hypothetical protein
MADMQDAIFTTRETKENLDLSEEEIIRMSLSTTVQTWHLSDDLKVCLLRNDTEHPFLTSDDPAIVTNRLHLQKLKAPTFGLMSSGLLFILPLTPRICALCYDGDVYSVENRNGWALVKTSSDVAAINQHQYLKCGQNIYFPIWVKLTCLEKEFQSASGRRLAQSWEVIVGDLVDEGDGWEEYKAVSRSQRSV